MNLGYTIPLTHLLTDKDKGTSRREAHTMYVGFIW